MYDGAYKNREEGLTYSFLKAMNETRHFIARKLTFRIVKEGFVECFEPHLYLKLFFDLTFPLATTTS